MPRTISHPRENSQLSGADGAGHHSYRLREWWAAMIDGGWVARLGPRAVLVAAVYARHADADGIAWPSLGTIARGIGIRTTASVCRLRRQLIDAGILLCVTEGGGRGIPSRYLVRFPPQKLVREKN